MKNGIFYIVLTLALLYGYASSSFAREPLMVFVSILPQKYFVQQIGKDLVDVQVMVSPGANPATYEPKPSQMVKLSRAAIYFAIKVPFEKTWLSRFAASNPDMKIVHTDEGIDKIPMKSHLHDSIEEHDHDTGSMQGHPDPHIWLSPPLAAKQAATITKALQKEDPANRDFYRINSERLISAIESLDRDIAGILSGSSGKKFMVFHPSWGYFARTYGLEQIPIEVEGKNPKPAQLQALITHARQNRIDVVFVQPQFSSKSASLVAQQINGTVIEADPLAENWEQNLRKIAEQFRQVLE